jgi:hypothetical protein
MREAGAISPLTLVVTLEPSITSDVQESWDVVPVRFCGGWYSGCFTDFQTVYSAERRLLGDLVLTVYEGPSARVLQTERFQVVFDGPNSEAARKRVFEQLARELVLSVDVLQSKLAVEFEPVEELPLVTTAIERIRRAAWREGRELLEQAVKQLGGQERDVQARVWYDLALARWHAPGPDGLTQKAYEDARRALGRAIELDGSKRYRGMLERLERARARHAVLEAQRRATARNFALRARASEP